MTNNNPVISEKVRSKMRKVVPKGINHNSIEALQYKYRLNARAALDPIQYAGLLDGYQQVFDLRQAVERLNQRDDNGWTLGVDYLGVTRQYDPDGFDKDGYSRVGEHRDADQGAFF